MLTCSECGQEFDRRGRRGSAPKRCSDCASVAKRIAQRGYVAAYRERHPERIAEYKARPESKAREAAWMRASRAADSEHHREARLRQYRADPLASTKARTRAHGITVSDYLALLAAQPGVCAICRQPETSRGANGRPRSLAIDHDHETLETRGLLCHRCNVALGLLDDNPELLDAAAGYLRAAQSRRLRLVKGG